MGEKKGNLALVWTVPTARPWRRPLLAPLRQSCVRLASHWGPD